MYTLFVCLRYLRARVISYVAVVALAFGVATLIIVTSVMGGFQREFHRKIRGTLADVSVESRQFFGITEGEELRREIEKVPSVQATAPFVENFVLVDSRITRDIGSLKGIDPAAESEIGEFETYLLSPREMLEARYEAYPQLRAAMKDVIDAAPAEKPDPAKLLLGKTQSGNPGVLVGIQLYEIMKLDLGDELTLVTVGEIEKAKFQESDARKATFEVVGTFKTGMYEQDKRLLYAPIAAVQDFIGVPGRLSGINVKLRDYRLAHEAAHDLKVALDEPSLYVLPWDMRNENLIKAVATERWMIGFIVFFMIVLAGFNLTAILTMMVIEKTKDLGILGAIGASRLGLMSIFLMQGGLIAILGSILGTVFGFLFVRHVNWIDQNVVALLLGRPIFDPRIYYLDRIPTEVSPGATTLWIGLTISLGFLLAIYPALRAARLEPIEALRYE